LGYKSDFFDIGNEKYYHDFNIHLKRKLSKKLSLELLYANIFYDMPHNPSSQYIFYGAATVK